MQLDLSDTTGAMGNVKAVKYYTFLTTELDCTRKSPAFKIPILPSLGVLNLTSESIFAEYVF